MQASNLVHRLVDVYARCTLLPLAYCTAMPNGMPIILASCPWGGLDAVDGPLIDSAQKDGRSDRDGDRRPVYTLICTMSCLTGTSSSPPHRQYTCTNSLHTGAQRRCTHYRFISALQVGGSAFTKHYREEPGAARSRETRPATQVECNPPNGWNIEPRLAACPCPGWPG